MSAEDALTEKSQAYVVESLCCHFQVFNSRVISHTEEKSELLRFLLNHKYISRSMIEHAVRDRLLALGEAMYSDYARNNVPPDHLGSEDVFGYFLESKDKGFQGAIRFDHGETADEYIRSAQGLVDHVVVQLLDYKNPAPSTLDTGSDCCCH